MHTCFDDRKYHHEINKRKTKHRSKMVNMSAFKSYDKSSECRRSRKRIAIITLCSVLLVCLIAVAALGIKSSADNRVDSSNGGPNDKPISSSMKAVCNVTLYKDSCYRSFSPFLANSTQGLNPEELLRMSLQIAVSELLLVSSKFNESLYSDGHDKMSVAALADCVELLDLAMDHLNASLTAPFSPKSFEDYKTWVSSALTYHQTCVDGFEQNAYLQDGVSGFLKNSTESTSNSLAIITWLSSVMSSFHLRRLMSAEVLRQPAWVTKHGRKLLQAPADLRSKADIVVAKDGSGKYRNITAALNAVPDKSDTRFVIYVKKGWYFENVTVEKTKWNVVMIGDGMDATVVGFGLNVVDGTPTFSTATFAAMGKGFVAQYMGFKNVAGAIKHQAVALMSTSDQSVFYKCSFDAFQDTLYTHSNRQFYKECNIYGTVDFIFGNAAVIFQNCNILPKRPMQGQQNTITAQGKADPNQDTGTVIQNCTIWAGGNLTSVKTYLGRPWKLYSTTIIMQSMLGSLIEPAGWLPWNGTTAPDTIFYSEYQNYGPGASKVNRVKWTGLKTLNGTKQASWYTVNSFLAGGKWISDAGVPFKGGL